jgi:hypothetical protein
MNKDPQTKVVTTKNLQHFRVQLVQMLKVAGRGIFQYKMVEKTLKMLQALIKDSSKNPTITK